MDQRAKFAPFGLSTEFVGEAQEDPTATRRVLEGKIQLVYTTNASFWGIQRKACCLAIDEAHCIKTW